MIDVFYLILVVCFFAGCWGLIRGLDRLGH
jgi:hypothetical protein